MAFTAASGYIAGAFHVQYGFRNSNGYCIGNDTTPDSSTVPQTSHMQYLGTITSFTAPTPTVEKAMFQGGQKMRGSIVLGVTDMGTASFELADHNEVFQAYIKGATVDVTTNTEWASTPANVGQVDFPRMVVMIAGKFQHATDLSTYWMNWVFHNVEISVTTPPGTSQAGGVNPNPTGYTMDLSDSARNGLTGRPFSSSSGLYVVDGTDAWTMIRTRYPLALTTFVADGTELGYTVGYRPVYDDATGAAQNSMSLNGVTDAATSISTTTGAVIYTPAGTTGDIYQCAYQTQFVAI